jgi:hypothetical protein
MPARGVQLRVLRGKLACAILLPTQVADAEFADGDVVELSPFVGAAVVAALACAVVSAFGLSSPRLCALSWLAGAIVRGSFARSAEVAVKGAWNRARHGKALARDGRMRFRFCPSFVPAKKIPGGSESPQSSRRSSG